RMISRRLVFLVSIAATGISFFTLGVLHTRRENAAIRAAYDANVASLRAEVRREIQNGEHAIVPTTGVALPKAKDDTDTPATPTARAKFLAEIKQELQSEMGLLPVHLLRDRRSSFVELY